MSFVYIYYYLYFTNLECDGGKFGPHCERYVRTLVMEIFALLNVTAMQIFAILLTIVQVNDILVTLTLLVFNYSLFNYL